ncbi:hypothetical protein TREPR_0113 [Treponema primitia ZAS-2]|uniref:Lipoprotein n=2 Tax=Treponema primitia TaxID=88058 RepID=F5YN89_TREPZ|nr:hypothetical protein TREPR_0113 [Treponema primitia ZAS-2]
MRRFFMPVLCLFTALFFPAFLHGQTAKALDAILEKEHISNAEAAWVVLAAAELVGANASATEAFDYALSHKWLPLKAEAGTEIKLDGLSLLIMKSFDIKGGLMYTYLPRGRYAYRAMVHRDLIQGFADPSLPVSGEQVLFIMSRVLAYTEGSL